MLRLMTTFDYVLAPLLLALILWNMRAHELTRRRLLRPVVIAATVCLAFLHGVPTAGADAALVAVGVVAGIACGAFTAWATSVRLDRGSGRVVAAASLVAMIVTAVVFVARFGFAVAASNGLGPAIGRLSAHLHVHSKQAWVAALVLMVAADLVTRALILWRRSTAASAHRHLAPRRAMS
jgi:hypothetical protein